MKVIEAKPVGMPEAKEILTSRENGKELSYEQKLALEHLKKFTKLNQTESKKFLEELSNVLRMSHETMIQILNIMPKNPDELRMVFAKEKFSLKEDEINKISWVLQRVTCFPQRNSKTALKTTLPVLSIEPSGSPSTKWGAESPQFGPNQGV